MKLSEMNTDQMAKCMCELVEPAAEIMADEAVLKAIAGFANTKDQSFLQMIGSAATALVPLLLKTHYTALVTVLSAMTGKSVAVIRKQKGLQTIKDVRECLDQDLIDFFRSSAPTEKTE